jgi:hypothetical protein
MHSRDWKLATNLPLCVFSDLFHRTAQDTIFSQLTDETTPGQYEQAQTFLLLMKQELELDMPPIHYASQFGSHLCVEVLYKEASLRLKNLALLKPEPLPPETGPKPLTPEDIVNNLENDLPIDPDETYLGEEKETENSGGNH